MGQWLEERDIGSDLKRRDIMRLMGFNPEKNYIIKLRDQWSDIRYNSDDNLIELIEAGATEPNAFISPEDLNCKNDSRLLAATFAGIINQFRSLQNAYTIAARVAHNMGYYLTFKDFLTVVKSLAQELPVKRKKYHIKGESRYLDRREYNKYINELKKIRLELIEQLYRLRDARNNFDEIVRHVAEGDLLVSAEMQKNASLSLEREEQRFEEILNRYIDMEEKLLNEEGLLILEDRDKVGVIELIVLESEEKEKSKPQEPVQGEKISPEELKITLENDPLEIDFNE